ncbi:hypothetical protein Tco_1439043 [Tanacetum coccineum]
MRCSTDESRCYHYTLDVQRRSRDAIVVHEMFNRGFEMLSLFMRCSTDESRCYRYTLDVKRMSRYALLTQKIEDVSNYKSEKGLVVESFDYDEESISSEDEGITTIVTKTKIKEDTTTPILYCSIAANERIPLILASTTRNGTCQGSHRRWTLTTLTKSSLKGCMLCASGSHNISFAMQHWLDGEGGSTLIGADMIEPIWINERSHEHIVEVLQRSLEELKQERAREKDLLEKDNRM